MNERKFLPDIPLLPEEREAIVKAGQPKLPGAPSEAHESALLAVEEGLPLLNEAGKDLKAYAGIMQSAKRKEFKSKKIHYFINNPKELTAYFDTLRILSENWKERHDEIEDYTKALLEDMEKYIDVGTLPPKAFEEWLSLMTKSEVYRPIAERVIAGLFEKARSPQALMNILYNLTEAILISSDQEVLRKGLEILVLQASFLKDLPNHYLNYMKAFLTLNNDELLRRTMEVDFATFYLASRYMPDVLKALQEQAMATLNTVEYQEFVARSTTADPEKFQRLNKYYHHKNVDENLLVMKHERRREWPYTLIIQGGRIRALMNELIAQEKGQMVNLFLPMDGKWVVSLHKLNSIVKTIQDILNEPSKGNNELRDPKFLKALFYLTPQLSPENRTRLSEDIIPLRFEINREKRHSISSRGDKIVIVDEELKALGFKSITFKVAEHAPIILTSIEVANYFFVVSINQDFEILDEKDRQLHGSFEQKAFVEHMILSHLKELMCTERVKPGNGENNGRRQTEREAEFRDRRPHLRKMPPNHAYSREALAEGLLDPLRYDLARINAERGLTKEIGQVTYVKVSSKPLPGEQPLISRAPHATDRLRKILNEKQDQNGA